MAGYSQPARGHGPSSGGFWSAIGLGGANTPQQSEFLGQQRQALGTLQAQAAGQGPTAAGLQQQQGLEQAMAGQMAMNAAQRGFGTGGRTRQTQQALSETMTTSNMQAAQLRAQEQAQAQQAFAQAAEAARAQDIQREQMRIQAEEAAQARKAGAIGGGFGALASAVGLAVKSDVRLKENIRSGDRDIEEFLDSISPSTYDMKSGERDMTGVMAQDVEKTRAGKAAVTDVGGTKIIDKDALSLALAANANLHERLRRMEELYDPMGGARSYPPSQVRPDGTDVIVPPTAENPYETRYITPTAMERRTFMPSGTPEDLERQRRAMQEALVAQNAGVR